MRGSYVHRNFAGPSESRRGGRVLLRASERRRLTGDYPYSSAGLLRGAASPVILDWDPKPDLVAVFSVPWIRQE
jgi:hypothetical protein